MNPTKLQQSLLLISGSLIIIAFLTGNALGEVEIHAKSTQPEIGELLTYSQPKEVNWTPAASLRGLSREFRQLNHPESSEVIANKRIGGGEKGGVVDWLARLIGVQGKTLGEFLREYQVHVLYDLVFTFFKWIFFLYAGLLIP